MEASGLIFYSGIDLGDQARGLDRVLEKGLPGSQLPGGGGGAEPLTDSSRLRTVCFRHSLRLATKLSAGAPLPP